MSGPPIQTERLLAQGSWLQLLLSYLAGRRILAQVELSDLEQEVYVRVLTARRPLPPVQEGEVELRRYLTVLARRVVLDCARCYRAAKRNAPEQRMTRSDWSVAGFDQEAIGDSTRGPLTRAAGSEEHRLLLDAYQELSSEHRRVLGLRQFEGLTASQTARRMGRSEAAIHSLYRRALQAWSQISTSFDQDR